jgi:dinuclear metal center YbgI/SA1388 family protein
MSVIMERNEKDFSMITINDISIFLEQYAPPNLAEEWDNVGLLAGDRRLGAKRAMTCLTITPDVAAEAIDEKADLIVAHHPLPFRAMKRFTTDTTPGRLLWDLISAGISIYSPHTALDSAREGINQRLAAGLGLRGIQALVPIEEGLGAGRWGWLEEPVSLGQLAQRLKEFLRIDRLQMAGEPGRSVRTVAVACGAADEFLAAAQESGCDSMVMGEARFHACLEAEASGIALLLPGHFASERFAVECLAEVLSKQFPELTVWPSRRERDPLRWA